MRRYWWPVGRYVLLGLVAYAVFLIASWPAQHAYSLAASQFQQGSPQVALHGVQGTVWSGRAAAADIDRLRLESLTWRIHPASVFTGRLAVSFSFRNSDGSGQGEGRAELGLDGQLRITALDGNIAMERVAPLVMRLPIKLGGTLAFNLTDVQLLPGAGLAAAHGRLAWLTASAAAPLPVELGDLLVTLTTDTEGVRATIADQGGPLVAEGVAVLSGGKYDFRGHLAPRDSAAPELAAALRMMGRPGRDGRIRVAYSGAVGS